MKDSRIIMRNTDLSKLRIKKLNWDVVVKGREYEVVSIPGYDHSFGNDYWMYPRGEEPCYDNLVQYNLKEGGVCWGYEYAPHLYFVRSRKSGLMNCRKTSEYKIIRNDKEFCRIRGSIHKVLYTIEQFKEHPLYLESYNYRKNAIGRKVIYKGELYEITEWVNGRAAVILRNVQGSVDYECEVDILDPNIQW